MERQSELLIEPDEDAGGHEQVDPRASLVAETVVKLTANELFADTVNLTPNIYAATNKSTTIRYTTQLEKGGTMPDQDARGDPD